MPFSLEAFEFQVLNRQHDTAMRMLVELLTALQAGQGIGAADAHRMGRLAAALQCLFADPAFVFRPRGLQRVLAWNRWVAAIFAAGTARHADPALRALDRQGGADPAGQALIGLQAEALAKFCLLYSPQSSIEVNWEAFWQYDRGLAVGLCAALVSTGSLLTANAQARRERLLRWLADRLGEVDDAQVLSPDMLWSIWRDCSHGNNTGRHLPKRAINRLVRRQLDAMGLHATPAPARLDGRADHRGRPVMLVVAEAFTHGGPVWRAQARALAAARERFFVIGMGRAQAVDRRARAVFDEFIEIRRDDLALQLAQIRNVARQRQAQVLYLPSAGLAPLGLYVANMRLAPLQVMGLGHPATSLSACIDYVVGERDAVGERACFTEKRLLLAPDAMPRMPLASDDCGRDAERGHPAFDRVTPGIVQGGDRGRVAAPECAVSRGLRADR